MLVREADICGRGSAGVLRGFAHGTRRRRRPTQRSRGTKSCAATAGFMPRSGPWRRLDYAMTGCDKESGLSTFKDGPSKEMAGSQPNRGRRERMRNTTRRRILQGAAGLAVASALPSPLIAANNPLQIGIVGKVKIP